MDDIVRHILQVGVPPSALLKHPNKTKKKLTSHHMVQSLDRF